jgi:transaldolase
MFDFFFDTADIEYIKKVWFSLGERGLNKNVKGITTNPNAMSKINRHTLTEWQEILPKLCELVSEIRQDKKGEVHVQAPNSSMTGEEVRAFARHISAFSDGNTKLALKIAPQIDILEKVPFIQEYMPVNVTGLSDCSTALSCVIYGVDYVSIIPGRMEEVGINADSHLIYMLRQNRKTKVITGSMRTLEGLKRAVEAGTVPTIGNRVWDAITEEKFDVTKLSAKELVPPMLSPHITQANTNLSLSFFEQMDELGRRAYREWGSLKC